MIEYFERIPSLTTMKRWLDSQTADRVGKVLAAIALTLSLVVGYAVYQQNQCQARYAEVSNASQRARADAAEKDRQAQDAMFDAIADNPHGSIEAIRKYRDTRRAADAQRDQNPIPPAPSTRCG